MKISLNKPASGYNLAAIVENFTKLEEEFQNKVLYRNNPVGEPNTMESDLDMNGKRIYNVSELTVGGTNVSALNSAFIWRGTWSGATAYAKSDAVYYNGSSYIAVAANTNSAPPSANWNTLAAQGASGAGSGDVIGPASSMTGNLPVFDSGTGKLLRDSGVTVHTGGAVEQFLEAATAAAARTAIGAGTGDAQAGANSNITALLNSAGILVATRSDVASAATVSLTLAPDDIQITGTTGITAFTVAAGRVLRVRFAASLTLTNNANIITQTGANITTQAGDTCILRATAANTVEVLGYVSASANRKFVSSDQTVVFTSVLNVAHGLGTKPSLFTVSLKCVTGEAGYSAGDEITYTSMESPGFFSVTTSADATNVVIAEAGTIRVVHKSTGATTSITAANWRWVVRAWA